MPKNCRHVPPDFLLVIGGDGTILDATTLVERSDIPIIGLNTGRLGFLANITRDEAPMALKAILAGDYTLDERNALEAHTASDDIIQPNFALNEIAVSRKGTTSMISIHVSLNGEFLNTILGRRIADLHSYGVYGLQFELWGAHSAPRKQQFHPHARLLHTI